MQRALLGAEVVRVLSDQLGAVGPSPLRARVVRTEAGRYWELVIVSGSEPRLRAIVGLRRSRWRFWRLGRMTYVITPLADEWRPESC